MNTDKINDLNPKTTSRGVTFIEVSNRHDDQRLDNFLFAQLRGVPKSKIYRVIRKGEVRVNKGRCRPDTRIFEGDVVRIPPVAVREDSAKPKLLPSHEWKKRLEAAVIFETKDILLINKPAGIAVHGGSGVDYGVIEVLKSLRGDREFLELAHRIDKETSGCLLIARSRKSLVHLQEQFRAGVIGKQYLALVQGVWPKHLSEINAPLLRKTSQAGDRYVVVSAEGKSSVSQFSVLAASPKASLVKVNLLTGRTHQIRVHTAYAGHSIVGDSKYGEDSPSRADRMMLHSWKVTFDDLEGQRHQIEAAPDSLFDQYAKQLECEL